jgi:tyrosyl-tRNA synthetase
MTQKPKKLLETILSFKKDEQVIGKFRRMQINKSNEPWVIFGPLASTHFDLGTILTLASQLQTPPKGSEIILILPDWSSFTLNCLGGEQKSIEAAYSLLMSGLSALFPGLQETVRVFLQSQAILTNPNDYWISVINVGRKFSLGQIRSVDEANQQVAQVISALMHVGDVLGSSAAHIVSTPAQELINQLAVDYCSKINNAEVIVPKIHVVPAVNLQLRDAKGDGADDPDLFLFPFLDAQTDISRKLKNAFCAPEKIDYNPVLVLAEAVSLPFQKKITIKRSADNGGDKDYTDSETL